jgi:YidC/Oxa1 family membrane protein insertase
MPAQKNPLLRLVVPIVVAAVGVVIVVAGYRNATVNPKTQPLPGSQATAPADPAATQATGAAADHSAQPASPQTAPGAPESQSEPSAAPTIGAAPASAAPGTSVPQSSPPPAEPSSGLRAEVVPPITEALLPVGGLQTGGPFEAEITFTPLGAGVDTLTMAAHFETVEKKDHYQVQQRIVVTLAGGRRESLTSLAVRGVVVDGQFVDLFGTAEAPVWRQTGPGAFEARIIDAASTPVMIVTRRYELQPDSFVFRVDQRVKNLTGKPATIEWVQYGPVELHEDVSGYGLDMRRVRFGYLLPAQSDPSRQIVEADHNLDGRATFIDRVVKSRNDVMWPRPDAFRSASELVWLAQTSRYFTFAIMPLIDEAAAAANAKDPAAAPLAKALTLASEVHGVVRGDGSATGSHLLVQLTSGPRTIAPGAEESLGFSAYAGPLGRTQLSAGADPLFSALGLRELVIYNLGGPCAWCTFQWLAKGLLAFLALLHGYVVFDWAVAIMILVVCVRATLHPITRRSQIGMMRFSRQMAAIAPKQQKVREKYKSDPKKMQEEMIRLMKEERVNYAGALGCLPMFLQSPVWFALYAMLYFSFDLRHEAGFYGVFQAVSGGRWDFLADLSVADHFVYFGRSIANIPLLGHITGLNVLPVLMGFVFYVQQKYMTPPPTTALTPEQEMQQKMMKVMTVFLFPVLMYNAPAGLSIYFITNSTLGILESRWIRAHVDELDKNPPPVKPGSGNSWMKRVENMAKQQQEKALKRAASKPGR